MGDMFIVDVHTHVFPDHLAHDTVKAMAEKAGVPLFTNGTINGLVSRMDKNDVDYSVTLPIATKAEQVKSINNWLIENKHERIISFGSIHPEYEDIEGELKRIKNAGCPGIKLHPDYQSFYPPEKRMQKIYELCTSLGLIILFHCGDDIGHPKPGHSLPRQIVEVVHDHPELTIICAHMGGFEMWDQSEKYLVGKNIYLDTSYSFPFMPEERIISIMRKHNMEQILMGSDSPWGDVKDDITAVKKSRLSAEEKEKVLGLNAKRLFNL